MKPDVRRYHFLGAYEWRLGPEYFERTDRRGYRLLFDRVFYDEIESLIVFQRPDLTLFLRGLLFALATAPLALLLRLAAPDWSGPLLVAGVYIASIAAGVCLLAFGRRLTIIRFETQFGPKEIVFNRGEAFRRRFLDRLVSLIRSAQTGPVPEAS